MTGSIATLDSRSLVEALKLVNLVIETHYIPILAVAVARFGSKSRLVATNLDQELTIQLRAESTAEFEVSIDPKKAITALGNSTGQVTASIDADGTHITTGQVIINGPLDAALSDYPSLKMGEPFHHFEIDQRELYDALQAVRFAISTEETRYYLNGVFLTAVDGQMALVATDGFRMSRHLLGRTYNGPDIIIPSDTVRTLMHLLRRDTGTSLSALISVKDTVHHKTYAVTFSGTGWALKSRCIDGTFPNWRTLLNKTIGDIGNQPAVTAKLTQAQVSRLPKQTPSYPVIIDPDARIMRTHTGHDNVEMRLKGTGNPFCVDAQQLRQLIGAVGDVEFTGCAPDAAFIVQTKNPSTIVVQMPMKMPNGFVLLGQNNAPDNGG